MLWSDALSNITIKGGSLEQNKIFFTSYYHTLFAPFVFKDVNGDFRKMSSVIETENSSAGEFGADKPDYVMNASDVRHNKSTFTNYSIYSMWDTFRAAHPLTTILNKQRAVDFVYDLLNKYKTGGILPKWELHSDYTGEMDGYPSVAVIADTMVKFPDSFTDDDFKLALEAALVSSNFDESIGLNMGWKPYKNAWSGDKRWITMTKHASLQEHYGFIPADAKLDDEPYMSIVSESVSYGLEDSYYDWCIAQIASIAMSHDILKKSDVIQTINTQAKTQTVAEIKTRYLKRSQSFKNYFDYNPAYYANYAGDTGNKPTGFMRPVLRNGIILNNAIKDDSTFGYIPDALQLAG
ncbi:hypothetical protein JI57_02415 [Psychromonas sp. PRT-SC03]|nr:hypothetical protein JI57_02415 [Psychromonas sp. PRT-SC03]